MKSKDSALWGVSPDHKLFQYLRAHWKNLSAAFSRALKVNVRLASTVSWVLIFSNFSNATPTDGAGYSFWDTFSQVIVLLFLLLGLGLFVAYFVLYLFKFLSKSACFILSQRESFLKKQSRKECSERSSDGKPYSKRLGNAGIKKIINKLRNVRNIHLNSFEVALGGLSQSVNFGSASSSRDEAQRSTIPDCLRIRFDSNGKLIPWWKKVNWRMRMQEVLIFESSTLDRASQFRTLRVQADVDLDGFELEHIEDCHTGESLELGQLEPADRIRIKDYMNDQVNWHRDMERDVSSHPAESEFPASFIDWVGSFR